MKPLSFQIMLVLNNLHESFKFSQNASVEQPACVLHFDSAFPENASVEQPAMLYSMPHGSYFRFGTID